MTSFSFLLSFRLRFFLLSSLSFSLLPLSFLSSFISFLLSSYFRLSYNFLPSIYSFLIQTPFCFHFFSFLSSSNYLFLLPSSLFLSFYLFLPSVAFLFFYFFFSCFFLFPPSSPFSTSFSSIFLRHPFFSAGVRVRFLLLLLLSLSYYPCYLFHSPLPIAKSPFFKFLDLLHPPSTTPSPPISSPTLHLLHAVLPRAPEF